EQHPQDLDWLNRIFRAAHSIKGNAGMFHLTAIAGLTHSMENILDKLRNEKLLVTPYIIDVLLRALDGLKSLLDAAQGGHGADESAIQALEEELNHCHERSSEDTHDAMRQGEDRMITPAIVQPMPWRLVQIEWDPFPELFQRGLDPAQIFNELHGLGMMKSLQVRTERLPALERLDPEQCYLAWALELETDVPIAVIEAVFEFVKDESALTIMDCTPESPEAYKRVGDLLIEEGIVTAEQVAEGLAKQKPLGEILVEEKNVTPQQVDKAL